MRRFQHIFIIFVTCAAICSCNGGFGKTEPNVAAELTIHGLSEEHWTYFSFEKGEVVGTGKFDDDADDAAWAKRRDWDFAICGDRIKTNSGTSGEGLGGVQKDNAHNLTTLSTAPTEGYLVDEEQIIR
jgi:hypothetical protein